MTVKVADLRRDKVLRPRNFAQTRPDITSCVLSLSPLYSVYFALHKELATSS